MSYIFDVDEETVWSPALRVGELYVGSTWCIAKVHDKPTGLIMEAGDPYQIDIPAFESLTRSVLGEYFISNHPICREQVRPWLLISVAILKRVGVSMGPETNEHADFIRQADAYARSMPT